MIKTRRKERTKKFYKGNMTAKVACVNMEATGNFRESEEMTGEKCSQRTGGRTVMCVERWAGKALMKQKDEDRDHCSSHMSIPIHFKCVTHSCSVPNE